MSETRNSDGRFKKGFSGNPEGRKPDKTFRDYFNEEEEEALMSRIKQELKGDAKGDIIKMTVEHLFGKPKQNIELDGEIITKTLTDEQAEQILRRRTERNSDSSEKRPD